jgi:predicted nucleic acid-binding protein
MKTVSNTKIFVDTNVLFYANNPDDAFGEQALIKLKDLAKNNNELLISGQVIREYTVITIRNAQYHKLPMSPTIERVLTNIAVFRRDFVVLHETAMTLNNWEDLLPQLTTSKDVFDFNIAALLKSEGIEYILTHNVRDFEKFSNWLTVIPLID